MRLRIPRFMTIEGAALATFDGPVELPMHVAPGTASVTLPEIGPGAIVVLYADAGVISEMRRIQAGRVAEHFVPMPDD